MFTVFDGNLLGRKRPLQKDFFSEVLAIGNSDERTKQRRRKSETSSVFGARSQVLDFCGYFEIDIIGMFCSL
jgi:hypothetical protein